MDTEKSDFLSRKFLMALGILILAVGVPLLFKANGISDAITITVLVMIGSVGTAYGIMNLKEAKLQLESDANALISQGKIP